MSSYKNIYYPLYARNGLHSFLKHIPHSKKDRILVPSYSCGDEIQAVIESGFSVEPYRIKTDNLEIDAEDLKKKMIGNVRGIIITHYFGFPQRETEKICHLAEKKGLFVIEDCAHLLFDGGFKLSGSAAIFSLRKFFPVPDGGVLIVDGRKYGIEDYKFKKAPPAAVSFDEKIYSLMKSGRIIPGTTIKEIYKSEGESIKEYGPRLGKWGGYSLGMPVESVKKIKKSEMRRIRSERKKFYRSYVDFFQEKKFKEIKPVFGYFDSKVTPLFFPVIYKRNDIGRIRKKLSKLGNIVRPFWEHTHPAVDRKKFKEAGFLKDHIFILPMSGNLKSVFGVINDVFV